MQSTTWIPVICQECGNEFRVTPSQLKVRTPLYCSQECYQKGRKGRGKYKQGKPLPRLCEICGKEYAPRNSTQRFCSRECFFKHLSGPGSATWKGGRLVNQEGYVLIYAPDNPSSHDGYIKEHRLVMEQTLGRRLSREESVHHVNGVKSDNRPENLQLVHSYHGKGVCYVCADCGSHNIVPVNK